MTTHWLPLSSVRLADAPRVGGKAAGLGEAIAAGARVPAGIVVPPETLAAVLKSARLTDEHAKALEAARQDDLAPAAALAAKLAEVAWPKELSGALDLGVAGLKATRLAVRSSGSLEDGEASAAAGLYESRLDVEPTELLPAINRCWAAAYAGPALAHALAMGQDPAHFKLALVVQAMVQPQAAGVVFTLDPTDAARAHMRVGVVAGQGEALVQGKAGQDLRVPRQGAVAASWHAALRDVALKLERRFGRALDLEFAYDGKVHILQARPIAGLPAGAESRPPIRWSRDLAEERFPDPISPMGWSVLQPAFATNLRVLDRRFGLQALRPDEVARVIGGRVYNNRDFFKIPGSMRFRAAAHLPFLGAYARQALRLLAPANLAALPLLRGPKAGPLGASPRDPRFLAAAGIFEAFVFHHAAEVEAAWTRDFPGLMERMAKLAETRFEGLDDAALQAFIDELLAVCDAYMEPDLAIYVIKMACRWLVDETAVLAGGDRAKSPLTVLTGGLADNATLAMNAAIEDLAATVAGDSYLATALRVGDRPASSAAWQRSAARPLKDAFLATYGHVTLSWDLRVPTYGERPELLEDLLVQRLRAPGAGRVADRRPALAALREAETDRIATLLAPTPWAPAFFRKLLATLHTFMRLDEEHHLFSARMIPTDRRLVLELARRFQERGVVDTPDDVFFLTLDEARQILTEKTPHSRKRLVARRRAAFERALAVAPVEEYLDDQPVLAEAPVPQAGALVGQGASPGVVEGRVRVVSSMADLAAFQPGEILVAPTPKPSYTPLFAVAAGLVTARGSTLSHGLITAREYGLPAVTEIHDALQRLQTGQRVRLDGTSGTVMLLADSPVLPFGSRR